MLGSESHLPVDTSGSVKKVNLPWISTDLNQSDLCVHCTQLQQLSCVICHVFKSLVLKIISKWLRGEKVKHLHIVQCFCCWDCCVFTLKVRLYSSCYFKKHFFFYPQLKRKQSQHLSTYLFTYSTHSHKLLVSNTRNANISLHLSALLSFSLHLKTE